MGGPRKPQHDDEALSYKERYELFLREHEHAVADLNSEIESLESVILDRDEEISYLHDEIENLCQDLNNTRE